MFRTVPLSITRSFSLYTQQWYMSYKFADSLRAGSGWNSDSAQKLCRKPVWHITLLRVQWKTPDDGQRNSPKYVDFNSKNKFQKLVHLVGFIKRTFIMMHGHMNVKSNVLTFMRNGRLLPCSNLVSPGYDSNDHIIMPYTYKVSAKRRADGQ
jgi:hypothetical protein